MAGIRGILCWITCIGGRIQHTEVEMQKRANELYNKNQELKREGNLAHCVQFTEICYEHCVYAEEDVCTSSRRRCALCGMYVWGMMLMCNRRQNPHCIPKVCAVMYNYMSSNW